MKTVFMSLLIFLFPLFGMTEPGGSTFNGAALSDGEQVFDDNTPRITEEEQTTLSEGGDGEPNATDAPNLSNMGTFTQEQGSLDGAHSGQKAGSSVNALGMIMGAMFMTQCGPRNPVACMLAAKSFMDAKTGGEANGMATSTAFDLSPGDETGNGSNNGGANGTNADAAQDQLNKLAEMGYTVNPNGTVTTPDGQTLSAEDLSSEQGLQDKGFTPSQAAQAVNMLEDVKSKALEEVGQQQGQVMQASSLGDANGGGSGGGIAVDSAGQGMDSISEEVVYRNRNKKVKVGRMTASEASQLSQNFNGEPIGIGMGNLFMIVHQKYNQENEQKAFFEKEHGN